MDTATQGEREDPAPQVSTRKDEGSLSAVVAMIACNVVFLLMLAA